MLHFRAKCLHTLFFAWTILLICSCSAFSQSGSISVVSSPMWATRSNHTATLLHDGSVLIAGGAGANPLFESFQTSPSPAFALLGSMAVTRTGDTATLLPDGRVLLVGGTDAQGVPLASAEIYDPQTGTSTPTSGTMHWARAYHRATLLSDGTVLITGGIGANGAPLNTAEIFDPTTGMFTPTIGNMQVARAHHTATLLENGLVLLTGGADYSTHDVCNISSCGHTAVWIDGESSAEIYNPSTGSFTLTGSMQVGRWDHTATLLPDGRVLILGGGHASELHGWGMYGSPYGVWSVVAEVELYDPSTGKFTAGGSLNSARAAHTATLLPSGLVFVAGGESYGPYGASFQNTTELFDPFSETSIWGPPLTTARSHHTATLLPNGAVLLAGGASNNSAELYWPEGVPIPVPQGGTITVTTNLQAAKFTITGPTTYFGAGTSATFHNAPPGTYTFTFGSVAGYLTSGQQIRPLASGGTLSVTASYITADSSGAFYSQPAVNSTFGGDIGFYPPEMDNSRHTVDKIRVYASVPAGSHLTLFAFGGIYGGGGFFGTLIFPVSVSDAPTFYELDGIPTANPDPADDPYGYNHTWLSAPFCDAISLGTYDNQCIDYFHVQGGLNYFEGLFLNPTGPFYPYLEVADANHTLSAMQTIENIGAPENNPTTAYVGEPVSTGNGNYFYEDTDFVLPSRGLPLAFTRSYNSLDNYEGPLGANWTDSYNIVLTPSASSAVIKWGDGHTETFTLNDGVYVPQAGVFSSLVQDDDGTFTLIKKDQTQYFFGENGKLTSIVDKNGNTISLTYDNNGNLTQVANASGRALTLTYDANNRITQITDPIGRTVSFQYDGNDNLVQVTDPMGGITKFAYDSNHRVTSITLPNGNTLLKNVYDAEGRVVSQTNGRGDTWTFAYDTPATGETTITDPRGNTTVHSYDNELRIVKVTDALGGTLSYAYDANNDRISITNQDGNTTDFTYDSAGNITSITDPLGHSATFTYDGRNDLLTATNPNGRTTQFSFDSNGNLVSLKDALGDKTTFSYDGFGELTSKTDARGNKTTYGYDSSGDLTEITNALGDTTTLGYDGIGRLVSLTDPKGHTATAAYDALSRLVMITDPLGGKTQFAYDPIGNLVKITDADGNSTGYAYDAANNLVTVTDAMGHVIRYAYDPGNNRIGFTNGNGNTTAYSYDALNRIVSIKDPLSFVTAYSYDPVGNVVATTDPKGQTNQFTYDALNRLLTISYAGGGKVAYSYDPDGNRTSMVDSHGTTIYTYDALDRLTAVDNPGGNIVAYSYDADGNRASLTYPDGKVAKYVYDAMDRLASVTDWLGQTTAYKYDESDNLVAIAYPNQASVTFNYDSANRLVQVLNSYRGSTGNPISSFTYVLDPVGNRVQATDGSGVVTTYGYNPLYELTSVNVDGKITDYTYDADGNRLSMTAPGTSDTYVYDADDRLLIGGESSFTYDADGNETSKTLTIGGQPIVYTYDAANRLLSATGGAVTSTFAYDGDGDRISQTVGSGTYSYVNDVASQLPGVLQESGPDGNISYAYGVGRISESSSAFDYFYQYDGLGSVVGLTDQSAKLAGRYSYDAWGQTVLSAPAPQLGTTNKFQFTDEALDPGTQLYYLRARYYDPSVGRFLTVDPLAGTAVASLGANRYGYANANPLSYTDPAGLSAKKQQSQTTSTASELLSSLISNISENSRTITDSVLKSVCSGFLPLCSEAVGLGQVKQGLTSIQQTESQQLVAAVSNCVGLYGTISGSVGCVYSQFAIPPADYETVRNLVIKDATQKGISLQ